MRVRGNRANIVTIAKSNENVLVCKRVCMYVYVCVCVCVCVYVFVFVCIQRVARTHVLKDTAGSLHIDPSGARQKSQRMRAPERHGTIAGQTALGAVIVHCRLSL